MGIKIPDATPFASAQLTDLLPAARGFASGTLTPEKILALAETQGFLKGDNEAIYVENLDDGAKWQLDQYNHSLTLDTGTSPNSLTADVSQKNIFMVQPSDGELELQAPDNLPSSTQIGLPAGVFHWRVYARNSSAGTSGFISFDSSFVKLPGSKEYTSAGTNRLNIIDIWSSAGVNYYRIMNDTYTGGATESFDIVVLSSEILTSNGTALDLLAGTFEGKWISNLQLEACLVDGTTPYDTNTNLQIYFGPVAANDMFEFDLSDVTIQRFNGGALNVPLANLQSNGGDVLRGKTETGNPANGDYDLRLWGTYRILDA